MLTLITGAMFAGKTTKAIEYAERHSKNVLFLKPPMDNRYQADSVVTHDGAKRKAVILKGAYSLDKYLKYDYAPEAVVIDELHLHIEDIAFYAMHAFRSMSVPVFVTGLNYYANKEVPPAIERLRNSTLMSQELKLKAKCSVCGKDAEYTRKLVENDKVLEVGGSELYQPVCEKCFGLL